MKTCIHCHTTKPTVEFYSHPAMSDGRLNACKECVKRDVRLNREAKLEYYQAYDRERGALPERKERVKRYARTSAGRRAHHLASVAYQVCHPQKVKAVHAANNAVRDGKLVRQPCEKCGAVKAQKHHDDYSKPLEVRWLCTPCHAAHHKALREAAR